MFTIFLMMKTPISQEQRAADQLHPERITVEGGVFLRVLMAKNRPSDVGSAESTHR